MSNQENENSIRYGIDENGRIDYEKVRKFKLPILFDAADEFLLRSSSAEIEAFGSFCDENSWWLDDYALFQSLVSFDCSLYD